jgi:type IV pilus assembly protein PilW
MRTRARNRQSSSGSAASRVAPGSRGFSLIELMIAMVLGLVVISGVTSIFLANQQTYRANAGLSDVQEGSRIAFEMLARDVRGAGLTGCDSTSGRVANVINTVGGTTPWYADWNNAVHGYDDAATDDPALTGLSGAGAPVAGEPSVHLISAGAIAATVGANSGNNPASIQLNQPTDELADGDIIMICDYDHAAIVQVTNNYPAAVLLHDKGNNMNPGNCSKGLGYPTDCSGANGNSYTFPQNSQIAELTASDWYIGTNPTGGKSLYRLALSNSSGNVTATAQEMVRNVTDMKLLYHQQGGATFGNAAAIAASGGDWSTVDAVQVTLTLQSTNQRAGVNATPITRNFTAVATVRNRVQ